MDDAYSFQVYFILAIGDIRGVKILSDYNYIYSSDFYFVFLPSTSLHAIQSSTNFKNIKIIFNFYCKYHNNINQKRLIFFYLFNRNLTNHDSIQMSYSIQSVCLEFTSTRVIIIFICRNKSSQEFNVYIFMVISDKFLF